MGSADARAGEQGAGMMLALHAAFRRDLGHLARAAEGLTRRPERRAAVVRGWVAFRDELHHHHTVEDTSLWPAVRRRTSACADAEVLEAME
ncbi:hemerythrin domain-containing protein [Janibacter sp. UYMM211]